MTKHRQTRVMVFGTFDILHKGHLNFFKQARGLAENPFLIVSVARDVNVKKIKGKKPLRNEKIRLKEIGKFKIVNKAVLGGIKNHLPHIILQKPDIIALGYDQKAYVKGIKSALKKRGLDVVIKKLKAYYPKVYKSSLVARPKKIN